MATTSNYNLRLSPQFYFTPSLFRFGGFLFIGRLVTGRHKPFYAIVVMLHNLRAKSLLHLTVDILPLLWYNITVIKRKEFTYYD